MSGLDRSRVERVIKETGGILNLAPTWVARDFLPAGHRLGLEDYSPEDKRRGEICERWFASTSPADNAYGPADEGLSYIVSPDGSRLLLRDVVGLCNDLLLGEEYYRSHGGIGMFTKLFDFAAPIPLHLHQMKQHTEPLGKGPKDEAYYFVEGVPMGSFPYSFLGLHHMFLRLENRRKLIPLLEKWETDEILRYSKAYKLMPGEGFLIPSGTLHAPGTALTLEMQESSDVFAMLLGVAGGKPISKDLLWKDVDPKARQRNDMNAILDLIDWEVCCDPYFYEHHHTPPMVITSSSNGNEHWVFYGTPKFSGKKTVVRPGRRLSFREQGAFSFFVWRGRGRFSNVSIAARGDHSRDEFFVVCEKAVQTISVENTGYEDLVLFKFFGVNVNPNAPNIPPYP
ncbi:MAG: hypothetical protein ACETV0_02805 [Nitrososphaeria archaeon]